MSSWFFCPSEHSQPPTTPPRRVPVSPTQSLLHYESGSTPPSSRVDPKLKLEPRRPLRLWDYWKFAPFLAAKASQVTSDVLSHHIWGPRRKTWGIEMTIITSLIRGVNRSFALVDIGTIRLLMSLIGLVPVPSDALVTPVSFKVKKRGLRGFLASHDAREDGNRELSGEWVVGRKTWQRMQKEWKASNSGLPALRASSSDIPKTQKRKELVVLYIHGGAYYLSSAAAMRVVSIPLAKYTDSRVFALDYRLAPETRFPGPLHDVVAAYFRLVEDLKIPPENIIVSGDSAGGALALALLMYLRDNIYPLPSGAILMSPWVDLTMSCESWDRNAPYDVVPFPVGNHMNPIVLYLGERTADYLTHPYASPLFGDFKGLPPLLIQAGDAEVLQDEIRLLAHKASSAGVQVMHELYEDAIHVFQAYPFLEASRRSFETMRAFLRIVLPQQWKRSPQLLATTTERGLEEEMENDRTVVVRGDGAEQHPPGSRLQMAEFSESQEESEPETSSDQASWVSSPLWHKSSKQGEDVQYMDMGDIPELELSPRSLFNPSCSPLLSPIDPDMIVQNDHSVISRFHSPAYTDSFRDPRRIQSTTCLATKFTLNLDSLEESSACPTPPPTTFPPASPVHTFQVNKFSTPRRGKKHYQSHKRSKSSTEIPTHHQQRWVYPLYPPSSLWTMREAKVLMAI